jgi:hypothetical protein
MVRYLNPGQMAAALEARVIRPMTETSLNCICYDFGGVST